MPVWKGVYASGGVATAKCPALTSAECLRFADEIDEFGAVAAGVGAECAGGDFFDCGEVAGAAKLALAKDHAEAGDGGGELEVGRGGVEGPAAVFEGELEELAGVGAGVFVDVPMHFKWLRR
jgi:hypothetical protein